MADESVDSLEKNEHSINTSKSDSYSSTGNSTPKSVSGIIKRDKVPHYLRASTGSCHDFCKFGNKHSSEEKARKPLKKRITKSLEDKHFVKVTVAGQNKKEKIANHNLKTIANSRSPDLNPSSDIKSYSSKPKTSLDKKKIVKTEPLLDTKILPLDKKTSLAKNKKSLGAKTVSSNQNASSGNKPIFKKSKPLSTKQRPSLDPPEFVKSVCFPCKNDDDPVKNVFSADNKTNEKKPTHLSKPSSSPMKSKPVKIKPVLSSSGNSDLMHGKGIKNTKTNVGQNTTSFNKESAKKVLAPPAATLSSKFPVIKRTYSNSRKAGKVKLLSHSKERNRTRKVGNEKVNEKILHVVETNNMNTATESMKNDEPVLPLSPPLPATPPPHEISSFLSFHEENHEERELSTGEAEEFTYKKNEPREICKVPPPIVIVKENHNKTLRRSKSSVSDDYKTRSPVKLKFRNVRVVVAQSNNNNSVRGKLRFRTARVVGGDEGKSDLRRNLFNKASVSDGKTREEVSPEKVVLKHQDVQGKRGHQGLFNNVIEQTASKLVESKKSKVKALVGAFETVISLQDSKPSSQTMN